jgi:hypothetical protein
MSMFGIFGWFFTLLRNRRYAVQNNIGKDLIFGTIYKMGLYQNWKKDPSPMIFVMYSGQMNFIKTSGHYTDGINLNYLDSSDKFWMARTIYLMRKGNQTMNGAFFYKYLKMQNPRIIQKAYRRYHTLMINRPRMVSAGVTNLDKLVYPYNDPFIERLNESISPTELKATSIQVSYSPTELRDRIIQAQNSMPIKSIRQNQPSIAPWLKQI